MRILHLSVLALGLLGITACSDTRAGGPAANGGPNTVASSSEASALPHKAVDWPIQATSAAGLPAPWNFIEVASVALTPRGTIILLHRGAYPIMEFESNGTYVRSWGDGMLSEGKVGFIPEVNRTQDKSPYSAVYGPGGCTSCGAHSVRVDPDGNSWVVDAGGHVVYKMDPDGKEIMRLGTRGVPGEGPTHFNLPTDVAFGPGGDFYVSDGYRNARVAKYSRDGRYLLEWGKRGKGPGEFAIPHNLVVDEQGRVYVNDRDNERVQVFDPNGRFLTQWPTRGKVSALALTKNNQIWAGAVLHDVQGLVIGRLENAGEFQHGIAVTNAEVYVARGRDGVQKFVKQ